MSFLGLGRAAPDAATARSIRESQRIVAHGRPDTGVRPVEDKALVALRRNRSTGACRGFIFGRRG